MGSNMGSHPGSRMSRMSRNQSAIEREKERERERERERIEAEKAEQARREILLSGVIRKELQALFKSFDLKGSNIIIP